MNKQRFAPLPERYFQLMSAGIRPVEEAFSDESSSTLEALETRGGWRHFPSSILVAATLYAKAHPSNSHAGDARFLNLAARIGDLLVAECASGYYASRLDHHRDTYMWLEAYRLLEGELDATRRNRWVDTLKEQVGPLAGMVAERRDFPRYQSPYIGTSPNHYSLWASTLYLAGRVFGNAEWESLGAAVLHRFAAVEQSPDGFWGEHSDAGPTTGYDYLTLTGIGVYREHSQDPSALGALRKSTTFHVHYTFPDGMPVDVINDRNRYWSVSSWGHFAFSHFPRGRRYAEFLTGFFEEEAVGLEDLGRMAQNALYFHDGPRTSIPQERKRSVLHMSVPAGIRKEGPWTVCLSGITATQAANNQFYLDRQGHLSVFHESAGLVITGANSKRQPELATFRERIGEQVVHLPESGVVRMGTGENRLGLAYRTFWAELRVALVSEAQARIRVEMVGKGRAPDEAWLTLQLCLRAGETLETATGRSLRLSDESVTLEPEDLGGWIRHADWQLRVDPLARLTWPVYPFNPYQNGPETNIRRAVGALSVPLRLSGGWMRREENAVEFVLEVR